MIIQTTISNKIKDFKKLHQNHFYSGLANFLNFLVSLGNVKGSFL